MTSYSLKKRPAFLLSLISLLIAILSPAICLAGAEKIFEENNAAVVVVVAYDVTGKAISQGSGFIARRDGVVVTNYHVISNAKSIRIKAGNKVFNVDGTINLDKENDIAILKVNANNLPIVTLGDLEKTGIGEKIYVISSPQGLENTISDGILSGKREMAPNRVILQITAPISPGSSGGPVFNKNGEVIGIATFLLKGSQNLNFAMPVDVIKDKITGSKIVAMEESQIEDYEKTAEYWFKLGLAYYESGKYQEAIEAYKQAIRIKPDFTNAYLMRGGAYRKLGNNQQAIKDFDKAIELDLNNVDNYLLRGLFYGALGDNQQAIKDFDKAIELNPNNAKVYEYRCRAYGKLGNYNKAISDCSQAIESNPKLPEAYSSRGIAYSSIGDNQQAIKDFDKAIELNPQNEKSYNNRGNVYKNLGNHKQAIEDFNKAIEVNPKYANAYYNRGLAYNKLGNHKQAIKDFDKAIELNPLDAESYSIRGIAYIQLKNYQQGIEDLKIGARLGEKRAQNFLRSKGIDW